MEDYGETRARTPWDASTSSLDRLEVDVEHLDNIGRYLDELVNAIRQDLQPYVVRVNQMLTVGDSETTSTLGSPEIPQVGGRHDQHAGLAPKIQQTYEAVYNGLKGTADSLEKASQAVGTIAEKYRTTEARNATTAADYMAAQQG